MLTKRIGIFALAIIIALTASTTVFALDSEAIKAQTIDSLKENILEVNAFEEGLNYIEVTENVDVFSAALKMKFPQMSDYERGKAVLLATGESKSFIETLPEEKVLEALGYISVTQTKSYFHKTADGELVQISKESFFSPSQNAELAYLIDYSETHGDLVLISRAYEHTPSYALPGRSYFAIRAEVDWVGYPDMRMTDLLVISSTGNIDNNYSHFAYGVWKNDEVRVTDSAYLYPEDGGDGEELVITSPSIYGMGVEIPVQVAADDVNADFVYAYYGVSAQSDITCQVSYAHAILVWTPSFSVSSTGSVSFGGVGLQRQVFKGTAFTLYHS